MQSWPAAVVVVVVAAAVVLVAAVAERAVAVGDEQSWQTYLIVSSTDWMRQGKK